LPDPGGFSQLLGVRKEAERHDRDEDLHQENGDRIVVARVWVALYSLQGALRSGQIVERRRQRKQYVLADELLIMQAADGFILPMQDQSLLVASMRHDFLHVGIRQIRLQLALEGGLAFRSPKPGEKSRVARLGGILPGLSVAQEKAQRSQPGEMAIK
jgi:hypothetical protein